MNELVSIIIPAYNVQNYVSKAIESALHQSYQYVEIVVIDDGSTDNTWNILLKYKQEDHRVKIFRQQNLGVSSARNNALQKVTGTWIMFLDADDWIEADTVDVLINMAEKYRDYLVCSDRYFVYGNENDGFRKDDQSVGRNKEIIRINDALATVGTGKYNLQSSCYKLFNRKYLDSKKLMFDTGLYYGEDGLFVFRYLKGLKGIVYLPEPLWDILERPGSATQSKYNKKWLTMITAVEKMQSTEDLPIRVVNALEKYKAQRILIAFKGYLRGANKSKNDYVVLKKKTRQAIAKFRKWSGDNNTKIQLIGFMIAPSFIIKSLFYLYDYLRKR